MCGLYCNVMDVSKTNIWFRVVLSVSRRSALTFAKSFPQLTLAAGAVVAPWARAIPLYCCIPYVVTFPAGCPVRRHFPPHSRCLLLLRRLLLWRRPSSVGASDMYGPPIRTQNKREITNILFCVPPRFWIQLECFCINVHAPGLCSSAFPRAKSAVRQKRFSSNPSGCVAAAGARLR